MPAELNPAAVELPPTRGLDLTDLVESTLREASIR